MSDFDREAEREKIREQFAEDERRRETTERMSELLLQGATMTNKHCDTCGDPVFRYDDQEFCPSCQGENGQQAADQQSTPEQSADQQSVAEQPQQPARAQQNAEREQPTPDPGQQPEGATSEAGATGETSRQDAGVEGASQPAAVRQSTAAGRAETSSTQPSAGTGDLAEARGALGRTVTRLARQAEESDDLGRTREYLAAAKEAAEALAAVKQADR